MAEEELTEDYPKSELVFMSSNADIDINSLPNEILEYILSLTSPYCDLKSTLQVCKRWYDITKGNTANFFISVPGFIVFYTSYMESVSYFWFADHSFG